MSKTLNGVPFRQVWLPQSKYVIKAPYAMVPKKLTLHETDNMASAINEINYMISNNNQVSYHIAADEKEIIQAIPFNRNAWHAGDGGNGYGNRNTIGWEMTRNYDRNRQTTKLLEPLNSQYQKTVQNTIKGAAQLLINLGIVANNDNIKTHYDWSGKNCPRKARGDGQVLIIKAGIIAEYNRLKGISVAPSKPAPSKPSGKADGNLTFKQVVDKAMAGGYGNYPARAKNIESRTNYSYNQVQAEINKRMKVTTPVKPQSKPSAEQVANDIAFKNHKWGNNPERARRLRAEGYDANWIQNRVNQLLKGGSSSKPTAKKIDEDGWLGRDTATLAQQVYGMKYVDGVISGQPNNPSTRNMPAAQYGSGGSALLRAVAKEFGVPARYIDGQVSYPSLLIETMQRYYGTPIDGKVSGPSTVIRVWQRALNQGRRK